MMILRPAVIDADALRAAVAAGLTELAPQATLIDRIFSGCVCLAPVDVVAVDADGGVVLVVCDPGCGDELIMRGLAQAQWFGANPQLCQRLFPMIAGDAPRVRVIAVGADFSSQALTAARLLIEPAVTLIRFWAVSAGQTSGIMFESLSGAAQERRPPLSPLSRGGAGECTEVMAALPPTSESLPMSAIEQQVHEPVGVTLSQEEIAALMSFSLPGAADATQQQSESGTA